MVGQYVDAVENSGNGFSFDTNTWIFLTSDHGDMRMEHQQFYKMVPWEASSRVPLVVVGPGIKQGAAVHTQPTSLLDIYPTMLALTGLKLPKEHTGLDGYSLLPLLTSSSAVLDPSTGVDPTRPTWVVSQGHMASKKKKGTTHFLISRRLYDIVFRILCGLLVIKFAAMHPALTCAINSEWARASKGWQGNVFVRYTLLKLTREPNPVETECTTSQCIAFQRLTTQCPGT